MLNLLISLKLPHLSSLVGVLSICGPDNVSMAKDDS